MIAMRVPAVKFKIYANIEAVVFYEFSGGRWSCGCKEFGQCRDCSQSKVAYKMGIYPDYLLLSGGVGFIFIGKDLAPAPLIKTPKRL